MISTAGKTKSVAAITEAIWQPGPFSGHVGTHLGELTPAKHRSDAAPTAAADATTTPPQVIARPGWASMTR